MRKGKVSGYKIDRIANALTMPKIDAINVIKEQMKQEAVKVFLTYVPDDVVDFWNKYPNRIYTEYQFCFYLSEKKTWDNRFWVDLDIPSFTTKSTEIIDQNPELLKSLIVLAKKCRSIKEEHDVLNNRIKCALASLNTYHKIKNEFPEAYKILVEQIDKEKIITEEPKIMCDDVEKLRAELSVKK